MSNSWKLTHGGQLVNDGQGWLKDKNGYWYALDENKRDMNKGKRLNMYDFMNIAGEKVNDTIFNTYYNNTVDSQLAKAWGVDLGFERNHAVPEALAVKYFDLVLKHALEVRNPTGLKNKYKFTVYDKNNRGIELFKIDKNNPFLDDVLKQTNPNLNSVINKSGCNFMATIAFPQLLTGNILNATQIQSIWDSSTTKKIKWWKTGEMLPLVDSDDSYVRQPDYITNMVFERMNINNLKLQFGGNSNNPIIGYKVKVPFEITKEYWLLSDRYFNYTYNPGSTTDKLLDYNSVYLGTK
ncbi:hypothetical protein V1L52_00625 [Treponema sp. HNW]|uniref:hypothetical protein n=1 Tax=Treponema sp. HNW TaxID=3116654 RepID=UPI003D131F3B